MRCIALLTKLKRANTLKRFLKYISSGVLSQMRHYWAVLFGEQYISGFRKERMKDKHPVELTYEEMQSMSMEDIKKFRDKSLKQLEKSLNEVAEKKKKEELYIKDAIEVISKTCLGLHRRLEILEGYMHELLSDKAFKEEDDLDNQKPN